MAEGPRNSTDTTPSSSNEVPGDDVRPRRDGESSTAGAESPSWHAATQAEDLDKVRGAVVDSADMARNTWVLFLSFGTYLAIAVGSVTHRQLLFEEPIRLPLLNVELPLVAFFLVAPLLFLIFHIYLLMHLKLMSDKVQHYNSVVRRLRLDRTTEYHLRLQLPDFMFVQYLAEPSEGWKSLMHWLLILVAWLTVIAGPVILLLVIQLKFLSYHDVVITWIQRAIFFLDIILVWWFWLKIDVAWRSFVHIEDTKNRGRILERALIGLCFFMSAVISAVLLGFSFFIAVFPKEYFYGNWVSQIIQFDVPKDFFITKRDHRTSVGLTEYIFEGPVDTVKNQPEHWVSNRLVLPKEQLVDVNAIEKINTRAHAFSLRGRDLKGAVLSETDLRQVDLSGALLQDSWLFNAKLQGALLENTKLQGATLNRANLQSALLNNAELQGALLNNAELQGALLNNAELQGASLEGASLWGAWLNHASLRGATLSNAKLQGASLEGASLQGAVLDDADLQGALLDEANLQGASLNRANLQGASLNRANLQGASLKGAKLQGASLDGADLWRAYGKPEKLERPRVWRPPQGLAPEQLTEELADFAYFELGQLKKHILDGIADDATTKRIEKALDRLSPEKEVNDSIPEDYWINLGKETSEAEYQEYLADLLHKLACEQEEGGAPFVAQGLINSARLEAVGPSYLPDVARRLLAAAENSAADCAGVKGLGPDQTAQLRKWADKELIAEEGRKSENLTK